MAVVEGRTPGVRTSSSKRPAGNLTALLVALAGAVTLVAHGADLLPGGWLGLDLILTSAGFAIARKEARPVRRFDPVGMLVAAGLCAAGLVALAIALGQVEANSTVRGDLLAAGLQFADFRAAGLENPLDPWSGRPTAGLWVLSLAVQIAVAATVAGRLIPGVQGRRNLAVATAIASVLVALWAASRGWAGAAIVAQPGIRVLGPAVGYGVGRFALSRPVTSSVVPPIVLAALTAIVVLAGTTGPVAAAWIIATVALVALVLVTVPVPPRRWLRSHRWLFWVSPLAAIAGPALGSFTPLDGGMPARGLAATLILGGVAGLAIVTFAVRQETAGHSAVAVVCAPVCVAVLTSTLALAGFFHAPAPAITDRGIYDSPAGIWPVLEALDDIPAPATFCESADAANLARRLRIALLVTVDPDRAQRLFADVEPIDYEQLASIAPTATFAELIRAIADEDQQARTIRSAGEIVAGRGTDALEKELAADPLATQVPFFTLYLARRCHLSIDQ